MNDLSMMGYPGMGHQQQQQAIGVMQPHSMMNPMNTNMPPPGMMMNTGNESMMGNNMLAGNPSSNMGPNANSHQLLDQLINKNQNTMNMQQQPGDNVNPLQIPMGMPMGNNGGNNNSNNNNNNNNSNNSNNVAGANMMNLTGNNMMRNNGATTMNLGNIGGNGGGGAIPSLSGLGNNANMNMTPVQPNPNANNPLYHPHLEDPSLLNNTIWKLQLQMANISSQSVGQPNIYARQNAMKKYLATQVQPPNQNQQQLQAQSQIAEASKSLVDCTKQALMDMVAPEDSIISKAMHPSSAASNSANGNSTISTPTTPKVEMNKDQPSTPSLLLQHKKLSQYSIDEDDEIENRMVAPKDTKYNDQIWHAIDLSNLQIFNISPNLMKYDFLTRLYLNGNGLDKIPPGIKNLSNLRVLDLSHNMLTELPKEIGNCYQLKYLYFFDNQIKTLPWELGNLCNIQFLGVEGNPLDKELLKILTEKSFTGLIFYLRDNRPEVPYPKDRRFIEINTDGEPQEEYESLEATEQHINPELQKKSFTLLSYNTLCQHYATPKMYRYTPSWALSWEYRREKLKEQILKFNVDILCLQEVEAKTFEDFWQPLLEKHGYTGIFYAKTRAKTMQTKDSKKVDGCCIFYKTSKFKLMYKDVMDFSGAWMKHKKFQRTEDYLNRAMNKDNVAIYLKLQHIQSGEVVWVVTTHLHWDPKFNDVKTFQVGVLLDHLECLLKEHNPKQDVKKSPVLICGDLNSYLTSAVYELLSTGRVQHHFDGKDRDFGYMSEKNFSHNLALQSSYKCIGELPFTNFTPSFTDVIDYIWFSSQALRVRGLLGEVDNDYISNFIGFPNDKFPSDHIPLLGRYEFTKTGNSQNTNTGSRKV
ncbi:CCR4-NOT core exoribonuclease subunit CCR4 [Nakaseomyces bracarensis]|uniref:CCR4-NOT core exoribonuclease subunit CCR4 n=1 Tax=Nakaseomyces bracarensis TaxID=273131 RepID=UPI0038725FDC